MVEHVDAPDGERHEPKGADSATIGQVYVSDGANSGAWEKLAAAYISLLDTAGYFSATELETALLEIKQKEVGGWGLYKDDGTASQTINTTASKLSINGLHADTDTGHLPLTIRASGDLWNAVSDDVTPVSSGDVYNIGLTLPVTSETGSPTKLTIEFDVGSTGAVTEVLYTADVDTKTAPYVLNANIVVPVTANFLANGGQVFLKTDTGTIDIDEASILINRTSNGSN